MDPVALAFYATVCGVLGIVSPRLGPLVSRLVIGAGVGVIAAALLPFLRGMFGAY